MMKKSLKKKMVMALAGIILAGSMGWSQIPAQAAVNGDVICAHGDVNPDEGYDFYVSCGPQGHMERRAVYEYCSSCHNMVFMGVSYGPLEAHDFDEWIMIEDRGDGLYEFWIKCVTCGYEDEVASGNPHDPEV